MPSDALTGNKDIDALNHVLAESYGAISSLLHRRCEVAAFHDACGGVIFPGMDTKLSDCVKDLRHECGKIRRMILGMGEESHSMNLPSTGGMFTTFRAKSSSCDPASGVDHCRDYGCVFVLNVSLVYVV